MATRRIVKVRRNQPPSTAPTNPSSNPFAGICLVPSTASAAKPSSSATDAPSQSNGDKTISEEVDNTATYEKNDADKEIEPGAGVCEANGSDDNAQEKETEKPPKEAVYDENSKKDGTDGELDGSVSDVNEALCQQCRKCRLRLVKRMRNQFLLQMPYYLSILMVVGKSEEKAS